jgi:hypothetical protein
MSDRPHGFRENSTWLGLLMAFAVICGSQIAILEGTIRNLMARCPNYGRIWGAQTLRIMDAVLMFCLIVVLACVCAIYSRGTNFRFLDERRSAARNVSPNERSVTRPVAGGVARG